MMDEKRKQHWLNRDLWNITEAAWLLCGADHEQPDNAPGTAEFNSACEAIKRAVVAGVLVEVGNPSAGGADRLYGQDRFYRPNDFVRWAGDGRFATFPFSGADAPTTYPAAPEGGYDGSAKWPWGDHNTELLHKLAAAAAKFWTNYDPTDNTTAPTNETVTNWLIEQGVAKRVAEIMAQILRPDNLPTGPRK